MRKTTVFAKPRVKKESIRRVNPVKKKNWKITATPEGAAQDDNYTGKL